MRKNIFNLKKVPSPPDVSKSEWGDWKWQVRNSLKSYEDFAQVYSLSEAEKVGFTGQKDIFRVQTTPYYSQLASPTDSTCPIRRMILPHARELETGVQQMFDPLGENKKENRACQRLIHRYTDRALFLVTDMCGVYCRYCTRKHFTASDQVVASAAQVDEAVSYLKKHPEIKEVIFSGGDPLTLSNGKLESLLKQIDSVPTVEMIRIGSRMPVACPMRIDQELLDILHRYRPIYLMTHFNHPDEVTLDAAQALEACVDRGIPVFNQLVLLNGINNHPALIYALNRRLISLRVKPYYMFQADPSIGTDHLRTSIPQSLEIQRQLWGRSSGLSMPTYIVDIPEGGGKAALTPNFLTGQQDDTYLFKGWDGVEAQYLSPPIQSMAEPYVSNLYQSEWARVEGSKS